MKIDGKWLWMFGFLLLMLIVLPGSANAQPDPGDCLEPDVYCPIDSGLLLLMATGIGFGAKKALENTKKKTVPSV